MIHSLHHHKGSTKFVMKPKKVNKTNVMEAAKLATTKSSGQSSGQSFKLTQTNQLKGNLRNSAKQPAEARTNPKQVFVCSECEKPILRDKFLLRACDKYWHENCLKCDRCHGRLGELGSTLFCKSNMKLCRHDYLDLFGKTGVCSVCDKLILPTEMAMKAKQNVYHLECFACQLCNQRFCVGDRFYLCENKVVCQYDYDEHILPIQRSLLRQQHQQFPDQNLFGESQRKPKLPGSGLHDSSLTLFSGLELELELDLEEQEGKEEEEKIISEPEEEEEALPAIAAIEQSQKEPNEQQEAGASFLELQRVACNVADTS